MRRKDGELREEMIGKRVGNESEIGVENGLKGLKQTQKKG